MRCEAMTIFLNRACPRGCPQCGISDGSRKPLSVGQWKEAMSIMSDLFGVRFFLFLGTEPLVYREGLVELVKWFSSKSLYYGFYSTSPEPLFSQYKQQLVDAGLINWSSGIDALPGMPMDAVTKYKVQDSIEGLQWMAERGIQTHTQTTIHKRNLSHIPAIIEWCQDNIPGCSSVMNFIEWKRDARFDFFAPMEDMKDLCWDGTPEEAAEVDRVMRKVLLLSQVHNRIVQTPVKYLINAHQHYLHLDQKCNGVVGPAVDCDGTMRCCGYSTGTLSKQYNIFELATVPNLLQSFELDWARDVQECPGCHWIFQDILTSDVRLLNPRSDYYRERWILTKDQYNKIKGD